MQLPAEGSLDHTGTTCINYGFCIDRVVRVRVEDCLSVVRGDAFKIFQGVVCFVDTYVHIRSSEVDVQD